MEVSYLGARDVWGASPSFKKQSTLKCAIFKRKFQNFSPRGGPRECFPGPRCGFQRAWKYVK